MGSAQSRTARVRKIDMNVVKITQNRFFSIGAVGGFLSRKNKSKPRHLLLHVQLWQVKSDTWHKGLHRASCSLCSPAYVQYMCCIQHYLSNDRIRTHHSQGSKAAGKNEWELDTNTPYVYHVCELCVSKL